MATIPTDNLAGASQHARVTFEPVDVIALIYAIERLEQEGVASASFITELQPSTNGSVRLTGQHYHGTNAPVTFSVRAAANGFSEYTE